MRIFISGGCKNGKSSHAQRLASGQRAPGKPLYYLATMAPTDAEDVERIRRHQREREGWGFETVEVSGSLRSVTDGRLDSAGSALLDSVTALLAGAMFTADGGADMEAHKRLADELLSLLRACPNTVLVSDCIFSDAWRYDALTEAYRQRLAWLDRRLAEACDAVFEAAYGSLVTWKGTPPEEPRENRGHAGHCLGRRRAGAMTLIFGGAYQGKLAYAKQVFGPESKIIRCHENEETLDFSGTILWGYHLLVLAQLRKGVDPCAYLEAHWDDLQGKAILCDDISCGVVPVDTETRHWREALGRCMGMLSQKADRVIRVFCGMGMTLK